MKMVITASTGNIGRVVVQHLLEAGEELILPVRSPEKAKEFADRGAKVLKGTMEDASFVAGACRGAGVLFWLTPPDLTREDFRAYQNAMGRSAAQAVRDSGIGRVVNISSIGAERGEGTGPINGLHDVEKLLNDSPAEVLHLRPTFFMENFMPSLQTIGETGTIFLPVKGSSRIPMVATRDIGEVAAGKLRDTSWGDGAIQDILGPEDLSFDEAAEAIGEGLGRKVKFVTAEPGATREVLMGFGLPAPTADLMLELYRAIDEGLLAPHRPRSPESTTPTTLATFARTVMKPMLG